MKYILDSNGYVESASCNPISCDDKVSQEYKGAIPSGYETLDEWILNANIRAYKIVNNNLVYDAARDAELQAEWELTGNYIAYSTEEKIIGQWIDGKPIYRKVVSLNGLPNSTIKTVAHGISNIDSIININGWAKDPTNKYYIPLTLANVSNASYQVEVYCTSTNIMLSTASNKSNYSVAYAILEYTKTTD